MNTLKTLLLVNWKSSILGVLAIIMAVVPVFQNWLTTTTDLNVSTVMLLIMGIIGVLTREKPSTTTPTQ